MSASKAKLSGRFVLRLSPADHSKLKQEASSKGLSLNQLCVQRIKADGSAHFYFPEQEALISMLQSRLKSNFLGLALFGSLARQENSISSDVDLLIVLRKNCAIDRQLYRQWDEWMSQSEIHDPTQFSPHFVHLRDVNEIGSVWLEAAIDSEILYQENHELSHFLKSIRRSIAEGKWQRKLSYGLPYWLKCNNEKL